MVIKINHAQGRVAAAATARGCSAGNRDFGKTLPPQMRGELAAIKAKRESQGDGEREDEDTKNKETRGLDCGENRRARGREERDDEKIEVQRARERETMKSSWCTHGECTCSLETRVPVANEARDKRRTKEAHNARFAGLYAVEKNQLGLVRGWPEGG